MGASSVELADGGGDHSPAKQLLRILKNDVLEVRVLRFQYRAPAFKGKALDRQFPIDDGDDDLAGCGFNGAVYHQQVAIEDAGPRHGVSLHPDEEGGFLMPDQIRVEVESGLHIIVGGGGEAGGNLMAEEGQGQRGRVPFGVSYLCSGESPPQFVPGLISGEEILHHGHGAFGQANGSGGLAVGARARLATGARTRATMAGEFGFHLIIVSIIKLSCKGGGH